MGELPRSAEMVFAVLRELAEGQSKSEDASAALTEKFHDAMRAFGSDTPDNQAAIARLVVRSSEDGFGGAEVGLALGEEGPSLSDLSWSLEDAPLPPSVQAAFPDLTSDEWAAFTRLTTLLYSLLSPQAERLET